MKQIIGISKVTTNRKITLSKEVSDTLKVDIGDKIVYVKENSEISIERA